MHSKRVIRPELLNAHAHDAKHVLLFATLRNCRDQSDQLRSLIILPACTSANVIYCITCTLCKKLYIGETGRRLGDRFREHLRDVEKDNKNASKPVARHFKLPNHSKQHMAVCGLSLHQGSTESCKTLEQKFIFKSALLRANFSKKREWEDSREISNFFIFCSVNPYI